MSERSPWPIWVAAPIVALALTGAVAPLDRALLHGLVAAAVVASPAAPVGRSAWVVAAVMAMGLVPLPGGRGGGWGPTSVDPVATVEALAGWWLIVSWARVAAPALARVPAESVERTAAWAGVVWAAVAAVHVAADAHALLGLFPVRHHDGAYFAPLVNPNHHATVLVMLWPAVLRELRRGGWRWQVVPLGLTLLWTGLLPWLAASMGMALALGVQALVVVTVGVRSAWWRGALWVGAAGAAPAVVAAIVERQPAWWRLSAEPRLAQWADTPAVLAGREWLGVGSGAYGVAYLPLRTVPAFAAFDHAHSEPLEWVMETGVVGALGLLLAIAWAPRPRAGAASWTWGVGLAGLAAHALVDFPLRVPGVALVAAGVAVAWGVVGSAPTTTPRGRGAWVHVAAAALLAHHAVADGLATRAERGDAGAASSLARWAPWRPEGLIGELRRDWRTTDPPLAAWAARAEAFPRDATTARLVAAAALQAGDLDLAAAWVARSLRCDPNDWRAWRLQASLLETRGARGPAAEAFAEAMRRWPADLSDGAVLRQAWELRPVSVYWIDALADAPAHWSARLAVLLRQERDPIGALLAAEQAALLRPEVHRYMPVTVDALLDLGLAERAVAVVEAWMVEAPDDRWAWYAAARINLHLGEARWPEAVTQAGLRGMTSSSVRLLVERCAGGASGCDSAAARALVAAWTVRQSDPEACERAVAEALASLAGPKPAVGWDCGRR